MALRSLRCEVYTLLRRLSLGPSEAQDPVSAYDLPPSYDHPETNTFMHLPTGTLQLTSFSVIVNIDFQLDRANNCIRDKLLDTSVVEAVGWIS